MRLRPTTLRSQRGVAALVVTLLLCLTMVLAVAFAQKDIAAEERRSANDYRAAQAFEAAEAGLEWALARVDDPTRIDAQCRPSAEPAARSWRERMLRIDPPTGPVAPVTWNDSGIATPLQSACVRDALGWQCSCPSDGPATRPAIAGRAAAPAFTVRLATGPRPGLVRVVASGCTRMEANGTCVADGSVDRVATASHEAIWAWTPALRSAPAAALTVRGDVLAGAAALGVSNPDRASAGLALHAGGRVDAAMLRLAVPNGSSLGASVASADTELASLSVDRLFARHFGMDKAAWSRQIAVTRLRCTTDCARAVADAVAAGRHLLYVEGDLSLAGPMRLGSSSEPIVLVTTGALRVSADVTIFGVLHANALAWNDTPAGSGLVQGAALVETDYRGDGAPDFVHDATLLTRLKGREGSFVRVIGSWKDF